MGSPSPGAKGSRTQSVPAAGHMLHTLGMAVPCIQPVFELKYSKSSNLKVANWQLVGQDEASRCVWFILNHILKIIRSHIRIQIAILS